MLRRYLMLFILLFVLPSAANAWTIAASTGGGGTISPKGTMTIAGTTGTSQQFTITPNSGYGVYRVLINGQAQTIASTYTISYNAAKLSQSITAYFQPIQYKLTPSAGIGGTIYPYTAQTVSAGGSKTFSINPNAGSLIADVKVNGTSVGAVASYTFTNVQTNGTIEASFTSVKADAGGNRTVVAAGLVPVTLDASASTGATSYTWSFSSIPAGSTAVLTTPTAITSGFTADKPGPYYIRLTAANGGTTSTSDITISVVQNATDASAGCISCHNTNEAGAAIVDSWKNSIHTTASFGCEGCHKGSDNQMPGVPMNVDTTSFKDSGSGRTYADPTGNYFCLNADCHGTANIWTRDLSKSSHFANVNGGNCSSCHTDNMHDPASTFMEGCNGCHNNVVGKAEASKHYSAVTDASCRTCHTGNVGYGYQATPTINGSSMSFTRPSSARASKHRPETWKYTTSDACATCHAELRTEFRATRHWNNHLEYNSVAGVDGATETNTFAGGAVDGQLNANESWTTSENGSQVTCATRCHFKPNLGPNPNAKDSNTYGLRPGKEECVACHDPHTLTANYQTTCMTCHQGNKHGVVPSEFWNSKHWNNNVEMGPEFTTQIVTTLDQGKTNTGGTVTKTGEIVNGVLNANDSYTTTENGSVVTCAYRCHFRPGMGPEKNVGTVLANGKSTGYITYTDTLGKYSTAGKVYSRPGGDACMACHDEHGLEATAQSTCYTCHAGGNHGWSVAAFEKSTHFTGTYAKLDGMAKESCLACHNAHSTEATFGAYSTLTPVAATGCQTCHAPGSPYGIYNVDQTGKAPHFQTGIADAGGYYPTASYITEGGADCASCHYHNNSVNAGWAEGGHGKIDAPAFVSNASHNWNGQGTDSVNYQASPQKTNCIRCHSSRGFAQFWDSGFSNIGKVYLDPVAKTLDKASAPLTCDGCHSGPKGVRGAVRPMPAGYTKVKSFYGYSTPTIAPAKMVTSLEFTDNKNSNICLPCHSQRAAGTGIKALFAQGAFKQYSVGTAMYPHEAQPAAIVDGKGGYEFASAQGYQDRMRHIRIGNYGTGTGYNNTGITSGNCSGCHMTSAKTHSLESVTADALTGQINGIATTLCANCHPTAFTYQDIQKKKDAFNASVTALGKLLVQKGFTQDGINVLPERKAFDMSRGTKNNAIAEKNIGAWFNWYLFKTADKAAYVHNPAYSRRLINDSIDWLDDNVMNDSSAATIQTMAVNATLTAAEKDLAVAQLNNPGCMGCHFGTGSTLGAEAVPGIEQAPHYNTNGALVPGQTFTQAQFVTPNTQCNYCHGYGHGTDSPGSTVITEYAASAHGSIDGLAWTDYDFKTRQGCVQCHTTKGFVDNVGATFAAGTAAPSMNANGVAGDATKQVLGCNACHSSTAWKTSVRNSGAVTVPLGVAGNTPKAVMTFADVGESNVCIMCHASRENGESLVAGNPTNAAGKGFTNPHYLGAAAVFYGKGGFQFYTSGVRYNTYGAAGKVGRKANWSHGKLGFDNWTTTTNATVKASGAIVSSGTGGQCVACHLGPKNTHSFSAATVANATKGTSTYTRNCYGCHSNTDPNAAAVTIEQFIDEEKEIWYRMFDFFSWQLAQYGINYTDAYPYFSGSFDAAVGTTFGGAGIVDNNKTRGAAMNLKLLLAEKGSHVHNRAFGRALIADSIVYLQKGEVGDRTVVYPDQNQVIKFSDYSAARPTSYPGQVGPDVSISTIKSYLTRSATGGFIRR